MHSICWLGALSTEEEEEEDSEELVLVVLVVLGWLAGGGAAAAAGGTSRGGTGFKCPVSWDTAEDREPWESPTPSELLHATIAISTVPKLTWLHQLFLWTRRRTRAKIPWVLCIHRGRAVTGSGASLHGTGYASSGPR